MQKLIVIVTAVVSMFLMACNSNSSHKIFISEKETLTPMEAVYLLEGNALLIDVREPNELAEQSYDVKNCINIPLDSIESKMNSIPKDQQVILACQKGSRSQQAFDLLKIKGFKNIANLDGGMNAWSEAGLPTKGTVVAMKACCEDPNSEDCNPDGTCKEKTADIPCCSDSEKSECSTEESKATTSTKTNRLEVYAFHGTRQCETCKNMKANTKIALEKYFPSEMRSGKITFQIIDVDNAANEKLAEKFEATGTALMVNNVVNGKDHIVDWSDFAFDKANDAKEFIPGLKTKITAILK